MRLPRSRNAVRKQRDIEAVEEMLHRRSDCIEKKERKKKSTTLVTRFIHPPTTQGIIIRTLSIEKFLLRSVCVVDRVELKSILLILILGIWDPHNRIPVL